MSANQIMDVIYQRAGGPAIAPIATLKLFDQVRAALLTKHYSYRTEHAHIDWIRRFILFHGKRHPRDMGA
jgi:hypothetical protein